MDRIASRAKREHVSTEAERGLWKSTYYLKQTTASEADTVATTKHPDLPKAKEWHREHFRRQGSNISTQPQTSCSQWLQRRTLWETESVICTTTPRSGGAAKHFRRRHVLQRFHALRIHSGTNAALSPQHTEGDRTQLFGRATDKSLVRLPHSLRAKRCTTHQIASCCAKRHVCTRASLEREWCSATRILHAWRPRGQMEVYGSSFKKPPLFV